MGKAKPLASEQAPLFTPEQLPDEPQLLAVAKRYEHQAKALTKDEERAFAVCEALTVQGWGIRRVCRAYHVSPSTVYKLMEVLSTNGKLETYKQRMGSRLGLLAEITTEAAIDKVLAGEVQANVLPIMLGVAWDKRALIDGDVTQRVESVETRRVEVADITEYLRAKGRVIDVESTALTENIEEKL